MSATMESIWESQRASSPASILAIGTATPTHIVDQETYPDFYFRITNSEHKTELKQKFKRMCEKSTIKKRHMYLTEQILKAHPNMCAFDAPSLGERQDMASVEVPRLGKEAAIRAIHEWGQPASKITHLVFCTTCGVDMPGSDYRLARTLGLRPSVKRLMMYQLGCYAGGTVLRVAKDIAENNRGARVLVVCSESTILTFRGPSEAHPDNLVGQALPGDGAAALIIGSDPEAGVERRIFDVVSTWQTILPGSEGTIEGQTREVGMTIRVMRDVPGIISGNIERSLSEALEPLGVKDWNSVFWVAHPGGPAILDGIEEAVKLEGGKLRESREVLREFGNTGCACVFFILDRMRRRSELEEAKTTGEGLEWGVLFGFGSGLTMDTVVLRSVPINNM